VLQALATCDPDAKAYTCGDQTSPRKESPEEKELGSAQALEEKKRNLKVILSDFVSAATSGIPCILYNIVDGVSTRKNVISLVLDDDGMTVKLVPSYNPKKFHEVSLATVHAFDYDRLKELRPENTTLKVLAPEEQNLSVLLVSKEGTTCILVEDEAMKSNVVKSLQILSARAKQTAAAGTSAQHEA